MGTAAKHQRRHQISKGIHTSTHNIYTIRDTIHTSICDEMSVEPPTIYMHRLEPARTRNRTRTLLSSPGPCPWIFCIVLPKPQLSALLDVPASVAPGTLLGGNCLRHLVYELLYDAVSVGAQAEAEALFRCRALRCCL